MRIWRQSQPKTLETCRHPLLRHLQYSIKQVKLQSRIQSAEPIASCSRTNHLLRKICFLKECRSNAKFLNTSFRSQSLLNFPISLKRLSLYPEYRIKAIKYCKRSSNVRKNSKNTRQANARGPTTWRQCSSSNQWEFKN